MANVDLVLDCADPKRLAELWSAPRYGLFGTEGNFVYLVPDNKEYPPLILQGVPEPKATKNRMHMDVVTHDIEREAARLEALGATRLPPGVREEGESRWITMSVPPRGTSSASVRGSNGEESTSSRMAAPFAGTAIRSHRG